MKKLLYIALLMSLAAPVALAAPDPYSAQVLPSSRKAIHLEFSRGKLIRLPRDQKTVFLANDRIADLNIRDKRLIYIFGKEPGETTLYALDEDEKVIIAQRIIVSPNITRIRDMFYSLHPNMPVQVRSIGPTLVLTGQVPTADVAEDFVRVATAAVRGNSRWVINRIRVSGPAQVNIRVKFAEVSRDINKRLGFNWEAFATVSRNWTLGWAVGGDIVRDQATGIWTLPSDPQDRILSSVRTDRFQADTIFDVMDDEGLISVLAEPNLTAMSGETASFLAGGEFPIPVTGTNNTTSIQFRQFGVSLAFTPTVVAKDRINLKVAPEVSQLSSAGALVNQGISIPALSTRKATTTVEVASGQSFVIAGLLQNSVNHDLSDVPGIKEIPIIGALFRSDAFRRRETELLIVVTPYIVRPTVARIPLPTDGYRPPKDLERFLLGKNHVAQPAPAASAPLDPNGRPGLVGPAGFVLQ